VGAAHASARNSTKLRATGDSPRSRRCTRYRL
jgi:hypothetical protein